MKIITTSIILVMTPFIGALAQQGMGIGNNNPQEMLDVTGAVKIGTDSNNNTGAPAGGEGTIRYKAGQYEGWDGTSWQPLGGSGLLGPTGATGPAGADGQGGVTTAGSGINVTGAGTVVSPYVVSATKPCGLSIGQTYQGGIIFYLDASGCHGLISAPTNQSAGAQWYNGTYLDTRAYGSGLFEGKYNTQMINWNQGGATSAAAICGNLSLGGYDDWYLPSIEELNKMYQNIGYGNALGLGNIGGFATNAYWSSTEFDFFNAWRQYFFNGFQNGTSKNFTYYVRAVRAF